MYEILGLRGRARQSSKTKGGFNKGGFNGNTGGTVRSLKKKLAVSLNKETERAKTVENR